MSDGLPKWFIDVTQMEWGQWRASAVKLGSLSRAIDGPYRDTMEEAVSAFHEHYPLALLDQLNE